ncbi:hypothetical protein AURDEDRAFT_161065 [Auricularia subglabra TFB-10046 SS5]|nr:hypothetical protein AURDEDRAFT_161065 [Auricularia subglabra TFB-10046 SS5]
MAPVSSQYIPIPATISSAPLRRSASDTLVPPAERQHEFSSDFTRWFAVCNISWNVAAHAETRMFFSK